MGSGGASRVGAHGVGAGGGARGGGDRPGRVAGQDGLPDGEEERGQDGQERDELHRRLAVLVADSGHAATFAGTV